MRYSTLAVVLICGLAATPVLAVDGGGSSGGGGTSAGGSSGGGSAGSRSGSASDSAGKGAGVSASAALMTARGQIDAGQYSKAIGTLQGVVAADTRNADAWNLLGYSSRKLKRYEQAAAYYRNALIVDPRHRGALEYQGELYLETGHPEEAKANYQKLRKLCGKCEEAEDLREALEKAGAS